MERNNRPASHNKNVTGSANVNKRGSGLGTGPVGTGTGRRNSTGAGGGGTRAAGIGGGGLLLIAIAFFLLRGFFGGGSDTDTGSGTQSNIGSTVSSLLSSFVDTSAVTGLGSGSNDTSAYTWTSGSTTSSLDESVAAGSRAKRTEIIGNNKDVVTIMVYMCGTDLESKNGMATSDLSEMAAATISDNVNLIVYTGGCTKWKNSIVSSSKNQIYRVKDGGLICLEQDMGTGSMTDPATLTEFIKYCTKNFPANRNELIFWDHGGGSISGFGYDEKNKNSGSMNLAGIDKALKNSGATFDFIGFDACLMGTLESALTLEKYADYMIASEETEPGVGWYYTNWLTELSKNTSKPTIEIGKRIVDDFVDVCNQRCNGQKTTLAVTDLAELINTVPSELTDFAKNINSLVTGKEYKKVSTARNNTREFAVSSKIDQVDLVNLCENLGTSEAADLANAIKGAVKYNRHSQNMSDSNGIAIYFPYRKAANLKKAKQVYEQIGMDDEYSRCITEFAGVEVSGQETTGGSSTSPLSTLLGGGSSSSSSAGGSVDSITSLLGGLLGGSDFSFLSGKSLSNEETAQYLAANYFDPNALVWTNQGGTKKLVLSDSQWDLVQALDLNVFVDDGEGYIDLGLDNQFEFDNDGNLIGEYDGTWLAINNNVVAYYHTDSTGDASNYSQSGYVPAMVNGERVELILVFDNAHPNGYVAGVRNVYKNNETETVAKSAVNLEPGDKIDFLCDYYGYDGEYQDSYYLGEQMIYNGNLVISYVSIAGEKTEASYRFTDIYQQHYWTPVIK